jgi:hypothetical protein
MRPTRGSCARRLVQAGLAGLLVQAVLHAPSQANGGPRISGSVAHTFAILGTVHDGATAFGLNALVPVDGDSGMLGLGVGMWADDMGQGVERLLDPDTFADIGAVGGSSRFVVGGGLAADFHPAPGLAHGARGGPFLAGTAGVYYVESREQSSLDHADNALGWSLGAGWCFRIGALGSVGPSVHYHRVFDDRLGRFMAAGLEWAWR